MDFVKEIERMQREQSRKLGLADANAPGAVMPRSAPEPAQAPGKALGKARARPAAAGAQAPDGSAASGVARGAAAVVAGMALLVPVGILVGFALSGLDDAWDSHYLYPIEALFVVGPLVLAVAVLQVRRQVMSAVRAGRTATPGGSRVPWLVPVLGALIVAAIALSSLFPQGVPLGR